MIGKRPQVLSAGRIEKAKGLVTFARHALKQSGAAYELYFEEQPGKSAKAGAFHPHVTLYSGKLGNAGFKIFLEPINRNAQGLVVQFSGLDDGGPTPVAVAHSLKTLNETEKAAFTDEMDTVARFVRAAMDARGKLPGNDGKPREPTPN